MPIETAKKIVKMLTEKKAVKGPPDKPTPSGYIKKRTVDPDTGEVKKEGVSEKNSMMVKKHLNYSETLAKD